MGRVEVLVLHTLSSGGESYDLLLPKEEAARLRSAVLASGAVAVGGEAWEAFRVARGVPVYGAEFGPATNPLESRLKWAISFNKGCYVGQEVVARLDTYRKVQRWLMAASLSGPARPGDPLLSDARRAGALTSVAEVPGGGHVALALVRRELAEQGRVLDVADGGVTATLSDPAFALALEPEEA